MVAIQWTPTSRRLAVAVLAMLLFAPLAPLSGAQLPIPTTPPSANELFLRQGEAKIFQGTTSGPFIDGNDSERAPRVEITIYNTGGAVRNIPVYVWAAGNAPGVPIDNQNPNYNPVIESDYRSIGCELIDRVDIPGGDASNPGKRAVSVELPVLPNASQTSANNSSFVYKILVNRAPIGPTGTCGSGHYAGNSPPSDQPLFDQNSTNNLVFFRLIKDRRVDLAVKDLHWCVGNSTNANIGDCNRSFNLTMSTGRRYAPYNTTRSWNETPGGPPNQPPNGTYFQVEVANAPNPDPEGHATWLDMKNYAGNCEFNYRDVPPATEGDINTHRTSDWDKVKLDIGTCPEYRYHIEFRVGAKGTDWNDASQRLAALLVTNASRAVGGIGKFESKTWFLVNASGEQHATGDYEVFVNLNDLGNLTERDTTHNNVFTRPIHVGSHDYRAEFVTSDFKTTLADPYPYTGSFVEIRGHVRLYNDGNATPLEFGVSGGAPTVSERLVSWAVTLDGVATDQRGTWVPYPADDPEVPAFVTREIVLRRSTSETSSSYITPGEHTLCAILDAANESYELNESNNTKCLTIYLKDTSAPKLVDMFGSTTPRITFGPWTDPQASFVHPKEPFYAQLNVTDDDQAHLNVTFEFQLTSNASVKRIYSPCAGDFIANCVAPASEDPSRYRVRVENLNFSGNGTSETWQVRVNATDRFHNNVVSGPSTVSLRRWDVQTKPHTQVVLGIINGTDPADPTGRTPTYAADGITYDWSNTPVLQYWVYLNETWTGIDNQYNLTDNFGITVYLPGDPENPVRFNGTAWTADPQCHDPPAPVPVPDPRGTPQVCDTLGMFKGPRLNELKSRDGAGVPGKWNITMEIADFGGDIRRINRSFILRDEPPQVNDTELNSLDLQAGRNLTVKARATDFDFDINVSYANFTRVSDNKTSVWVLSNSTRNQTSQGGWSYLYNDNITTGHRAGTFLGAAGEYRVVIATEDAFHNWNESPVITFKLNDTDLPNLLSATVTPSPVQSGQNVTFRAEATDSSNLTVYGQVLLGSEEVVPRFNLTETNIGNFSASLNVSREGSYVWRVYAVDSVGNPSRELTGVLDVRKNLGPRIDVAQPLRHGDGQYYAKAAPQIGLILTDPEGIVKDSIEMEIAGTRITAADLNLIITPMALDDKGYIVNYTVPASKKFSHLDVVTVNISATDKSVDGLVNNFTFFFTVDDVPPTVTLLPFAPRYRADDRNFWNVSTETRFKLEAADNDRVPTDVDVIRYRITRGPLNAAEAVYSPGVGFTIKDAPAGVFTGPGLYQIHYWAIDSVGNQNRTFESITVFLDDIPPGLDPFGSLPQGRFVNATFVDDRSGVDRAVVWWSENGQPYQPVALEFVGGIWTTILDEGQKDDRVAYYLQAWDRVNNTETFGNASEPYASYVVGNHVPKIKITAPASGSVVSRTVDILWTASDEDNEQLTFTVYSKAPGKTSFVELAKLENTATRKYSLDTSRFTDGEYTFRVTAADRSFVSQSEVTVRLLNRAQAISNVAPVPGEVQPGDPVLIKAQITKAQATVEAHVFRDNVFVISYAMNDEARDGDEVANDGFYSVRILLDDAGNYRVSIFTRYQEDGLSKNATADGPSWSVKLTAARVFQEYSAVLVLVGLLGAAGIGVAAYVIMRRR